MQARQVGQQLGDLAEGEAVPHAQDRCGGQGMDAELSVRQVRRGRLLGVPALHALLAVGADAAVGVIAGGLDRAADQVLDDALVPPQTPQTSVAARAQRAMAIVPGQRHLLLMIDLAGHGPQRRLVAVLASGLPAPPSGGHAGLHERRQAVSIAPLRSGRRNGLLLELLDPLLQLRDVPVFFLQAEFAHVQFVLQSFDRRLQHLDGAGHPATLFASLRHTGTLTTIAKTRAC